MKIGTLLAASAALLVQKQQEPTPVVVYEPDDYEFKPKRIDPLAKPKSKRAKRRAEAKARAAREGE